jgi:hypothetical protein
MLAEVARAGTLIGMFDPPFNHKDEHRIGLQMTNRYRTGISG